MHENIVIWGAGGYARVVADAIWYNGDFWVYGYLDDVNPQRHGTWFNDKRIRGGQEQLGSLREQGVKYIFIAIGDNEARSRLASIAEAAGFELASITHPGACLAHDVQSGAGTAIMAGAVIQPGCGIGRNVIINTGATVDHECVIEDGVHIAPGAHLAGRITVGRGTMIGVGAAVITGVQIGAGSIIGAGAVVLKDVPSGVICYGNPARVIRDIRPGDFGRI